MVEHKQDESSHSSAGARLDISRLSTQGERIHDRNGAFFSRRSDAC